MRPALLPAIGVAALGLAAPALAADPPPVAPPVGAPPGTYAAPQAPAAPKPAPKGNTVSPVTVFPATAAPKLTKSYPAAGQAMAAGVLVMTVTFDQPMLATGFDFGPATGGEQPPCLRTPRLLDDKKTFVLLCTTEPSRSYALSFNAKPQGGFENTAEHRADLATLNFTTTKADGPKDVHEAIKAAGLRDNLDMPIEVSPDRHGDLGPPTDAPVAKP
ncbi:hypothetical protein [Phenylobacterium sp.]|jgi:hypothetical protein|uniref:hypothetical protein n=1 Tax=Phenylobacterium sp. TaxID=1871053 RepID=UPI002F3EBF29